MSSKSRWRRFLPGGRKNKKDDPIIKAVPISEAPPVLFEEGSDPEMPESFFPGQSLYALYFPSLFGLLLHVDHDSEPNLGIDYGRFQEAVPHTT
jgi:hypothetical protein